MREREDYRSVFHGFNFECIARYTEHDFDRLLCDSRVVRHRLKIESAIKNAEGVLSILDECESLCGYLWRYVDGVPRQNAWVNIADVPARTDESDAMSKALKKRGFSFVGPTACYAFKQAVGMVDDHTTDCFRHAEVRRLRRAAARSA